MGSRVSEMWKHLTEIQPFVAPWAFRPFYCEQCSKRGHALSHVLTLKSYYKLTRKHLKHATNTGRHETATAGGMNGWPWQHMKPSAPRRALQCVARAWKCLKSPHSHPFLAHARYDAMFGRYSCSFSDGMHMHTWVWRRCPKCCLKCKPVHDMATCTTNQSDAKQVSLRRDRAEQRP